MNRHWTEYRHTRRDVLRMLKQDRSLAHCSSKELADSIDIRELYDEFGAWKYYGYESKRCSVHDRCYRMDSAGKRYFRNERDFNRLNKFVPSNIRMSYKWVISQNYEEAGVPVERKFYCYEVMKRFANELLGYSCMVCGDIHDNSKHEWRLGHEVRLCDRCSRKAWRHVIKNSLGDDAELLFCEWLNKVPKQKWFKELAK